MTDDQPDAKKPDEALHVTLLTAEALAQALDALRQEMRDFTLEQSDLLRLQIEALENKGAATDAEMSMLRDGFRKLQAEVKSGFALSQQEHGSTRHEIAALRLELMTLRGELPTAEQMPTAALMREIHAALQERRDRLESRKETRAHLKRGGFWLAFAVAGAVVAEPVKRGLHVAAAKLGLSWFS